MSDPMLQSESYENPAMLRQTEFRYLDLDGDGIPDAVETVESIVTRPTNGEPRVLSAVRTVESDIDVDGVPHSMATHLVVTDPWLMAAGA